MRRQVFPKNIKNKELLSQDSLTFSLHINKESMFVFYLFQWISRYLECVTCCIVSAQGEFHYQLKLRVESLSSERHSGNPVPVFVNLLRSPGIDSHPGGPVRQTYLSFRPGRLHTGWQNRFLGSTNIYKYGLWAKNLARLPLRPSQPGMT